MMTAREFNNMAQLREERDKAWASLRFVEAQRDKYLALLREWDSLIEYQYSGTREAMSAMAAIAQKTGKELGGAK